MNKIERIKMIKAMEFIARNVNDEEVFDEWLVYGVADGDIKYGDLSIDSNDVDNMDYYTADKNFQYIMALFLRIMSRAEVSGGLYCDNIVSDANGEDDGYYDWVTLETYLDGRRENGDECSITFAVPEWWLKNYLDEAGDDFDSFLDDSASVFEETVDIYWRAKATGNLMSETDYPCLDFSERKLKDK